MKPQQLTAALSATATRPHVALRASVTFFDGVEVDEQKGVIRNAAIMKVGPAQGHGFSIDATTLQQVAGLINASPGGVKMRFKHPKQEQTDDGHLLVPDDLADVIGRVLNARVDGDAVRGDIHLGDYAAVMPGLGDVRTYLLRRAKSDPTGLGLSAVIAFDAEPVNGANGQPEAIVARVFAVDAVDFVGRGAATPNGLLSAGSASDSIVPNNNHEGIEMTKEMKAKLMAHGMSADATDEQAEAFLAALSADLRAKLESEEVPATPADEPKDEEAQMSARKESRTALVTDEGEKLLALEGRRVTQLGQLAAMLKVPTEVAQLAIAQGEDVVQAKARFLKHLSDTATPVHTIKVSEDRNRASLRTSLADAILIRAGQKVEKPHERAAQLSGLTLIDMGRQYLAANGVGEAMTISRSRVWEMLARPAQFGGQYAMLAQSTDSFANITLDAVNKSLRMEYQVAPSTWNVWARRATAPDFKNINRIALSDVPGLQARSEGGEIKYNVLSDSKETYTLAEYTNGIRLTRQAIINDELDAFSRIPRAQATTAKQLEDDVCYAVLTNNAALSDSVALFHANHGNLGTAGAISVTTLGEGRKKMRVQSGPKGNKLNLAPRFLIVPAALETVADQFTSVNYVAAVQTNINPFASNGRTPLVPVVESRLDDNSATAWYFAAENSRIDTVEVCFLMDEPEPVLKQETDFDTDDIKFAVRHTTAAKAIDYRGLFKNAGA